MATIGEKLVVLLDIETLLAEDSLAEAQETEKEVEHELV
jgi:hypothetical protein